MLRRRLHRHLYPGRVLRYSPEPHWMTREYGNRVVDRFVNWLADWWGTLGLLFGRDALDE